MFCSKRKYVSIILCGFILLGLAGLCFAQGFKEIEKDCHEYVLSNGMKFIVLEREDVPVVSFHTYADVGSANESYGITGISHFLEHMAFKGTKVVGTTNYEAEFELRKELDQIFDELVHEKGRIQPDSVRIAELDTLFEKTRKKADEYVVNNEFFDMIRREGGSGVNAYTSNDATQYIVSLPANKLEFWMAMESDRFLNPTFREFYKEKDVVMEERRLGIETRPTGKLIEDFFAMAFKAHPYHHSVIGHMSDLRRITREDMRNYFRTYYGPSNLTAAVVGDVDADGVFKMAETYFGRIPTEPKPETVRTLEPEQWGERRVTVEAMAQPLLVVGYHRPNVRDKDDLVFDAMANILGQGRSSRLYTVLVKEKKIAAAVGAMSAWPGNKYDCLFAVYAVPAKDHTSEECLAVIDDEIEKLKAELASEDEMSKYKRSTKKGLIDGMKSNSSMARMLTNYDILSGSWRNLFGEIDRVEAVSAGDIQRIAQAYLVKKNRTIGEIIPEDEG
ncbi:MAG: insulinase family protein [Gemmatimonadota bacterium]|nr:MAG: insulinase family protein [Gemmatimonadota bacterium]